MSIILCTLLSLYAISCLWTYREIKNAPEMYFDGKGNLHRLEWFEQHCLLDYMYYDEYHIEHVPYREMQALRKR